MKEIVVYRWWLYDESTGEHRPSSRRMTVEQARRIQPDAMPVSGSKAPLAATAAPRRKPDGRSGGALR